MDLNAPPLSTPLIHPRYIGRFAPTPSGPLHLGSLLAALASYLDAKAKNGQWQVRIEDIDAPRVVKGATKSILTTLHEYGLYWDGSVHYQQSRSAVYQDLTEQLLQQSLAYRCQCSRKQLIQQGITLYPGVCRQRHVDALTPHSIRVKVAAQHQIQFQDDIQGIQTFRGHQDFADFIIKRKDGLFAYHLAVMADDAAQGITHIVRGSDLLTSTAMQLYLQSLLAITPPRYAHIPIIIGTHGKKLSKRHGDPGVSTQPHLIAQQLCQLLVLLNQPMDPDLSCASVDTIIKHGIEHWDIAKVPKVLSLTLSTN